LELVLGAAIGGVVLGFVCDRIYVNRTIVTPLKKSKVTAKRVYDSLGADVDVALRMEKGESLYVESEEGTTRIHVLSQGPVRIKTNANIVEDLKQDVTRDWPVVYSNKRKHQETEGKGNSNIAVMN
jgi:hypothetical protein